MKANSCYSLFLARHKGSCTLTSGSFQEVWKKGRQECYGTTPYPQGGYPAPPKGAAPYPQAGAQAGYPQAGASAGYPQAGAQAGYPQAGAPAGYPQAGASAGYPQAGAPAGYPQGGAPTGYPQAGAPGGYQQGGATPYPQTGTQGYPPGAQASAPPPAWSVPQYKGEIPAEDVNDDPSVQAPSPSAPTLADMGMVPGYENIGFSAAALPPPSYDEATRGEQPQRHEFTNAPTISEEEARHALLQHVGEHCCYGRNAALDMVFKDLKSSSAFHYTLETFAESRSTCWAYEPYNGQPIDGPERGPAPGPWDIQVTAPSLFVTHKMDLEVPHTASVKPCHNCYGRGFERCYRCFGRGKVRCSSCNGSGHSQLHHNHGRHEHHHHQCTSCFGAGTRGCYTCHGFGQMKCSVCHSHGNLKCYIKLTIQWKNHEKDHIVERTALPDKLIRTVSGQVAFEEQYLRVWPVNHFPDQEINAASKAIVAEHAIAFPTERILMQRHRVRIVPVTEVIYSWNNQQNTSFFVYGFEHKVHAPDYPQKWFCGCTIL